VHRLDARPVDPQVAARAGTNRRLANWEFHQLSADAEPQMKGRGTAVAHSRRTGRSIEEEHGKRLQNK
jgi:hypothetical protein